MDLTKMSWDYELFLIGLGIAYLALAWTFEKYAAMRLAKLVGRLRVALTGQTKRRKEYKIIQEEMRT